MIRPLLFAVWGACVSLSASYGYAYWTVKHETAGHGAEKPHGLEQKKTRILNVPMIAQGQVQGYIVAQFIYVADSADLKALPAPPDAFILDEAFRLIYAEEKIDFRKLEKPDIGKLTEKLRARVAERMKSTVIKDILVQEFNYVSKEEIRK